MNKHLTPLRRAASIILIFVLGIGVGASVYRAVQLNSPVNRKLRELTTLIDQNYLYADAPKDEEWMRKGIVLTLGDPYSRYLNPKEYEIFKQKANGDSVGIGLVIDINGKVKRHEVAGIRENSSAGDAGVRVGDILKTVDGTSVENMTFETMSANYIAGEVGTTLVIGVYRPSTDENLQFSVTRRLIRDKSVEYRMTEEQMGYIRVKSFVEDTADDFKAAVDTLQQQNAKGLMIDLRGNLGGFLTSAVQMADYLLADDMTENSRCLQKTSITYTVDKQENTDSYFAGDGHSVNLPIVILMDWNSASASELFTGAMRDCGRVVVVGATSYGKGIAQDEYALNDEDAVILTFSQYFTPSGYAVHGIGIEPDIEAFSEDILTNNVGSSEKTMAGMSIDIVAKAGVSALEELITGTRKTSPIIGTDIAITPPEGYIEQASAKKCSAPHFTFTREDAQRIGAQLEADKVGVLYLRGDSWLSGKDVEYSKADFEWEMKLGFLNETTDTGTALFGTDPVDGRVHWLTFFNEKPERLVNLSLGFLRDSGLLAADEEADLHEKLLAACTTSKPYKKKLANFTIEARFDGEIPCVDIYPR